MYYIIYGLRDVTNFWDLCDFHAKINVDYIRILKEE